MALPWEIINENMINLSKVMNDLLDNVNKKDITWIIKDENGTIVQVNRPNVAKTNASTKVELLQHIEDTTYTKTEVDDKLSDEATVRDSAISESKEVIETEMATAISDSKTEILATVENNINIAPPTTSVLSILNENETVTVFIDDYNPNAIYNISCNKGTIESKIDNHFNYKAPDITDGTDTTDILNISYKLATISSAVGSKEIVIKYLAIKTDEAIVNNNFSLNTQSDEQYKYTEEFE